METSPPFAESLLLFRVIPGRCVDGERVSSEAFTPVRSDNGRLSVSDSSKVEAEPVFVRYARDSRKEPPAGVLGVLVSECERRGLEVLPDPKPFPDHVVVDFRFLSKGKAKKAAAFLRDQAVLRGWCYQPGQ